MSQSHDSLISEYVEFARFQRIQHLKAVESCFKRFVDSRLLEGTYTSDEVAEIIQELCQCICGDIESELINTSHMNVLLLKQLFKQAENMGFTLKGNISEMQNEDLLEQIRELELSHTSGHPPDYKLVEVEATNITERGRSTY
ncbi:leucine zipper transcription factor-like protein 1 isoform X2 [Hetaerina americana]|uniref:leucine zipper transcription factor-like protein 1 isoform X2 n=1 Tax=Hetaerina americana TaxID=62018 RepID=UPI003A7F52E0